MGRSHRDSAETNWTSIREDTASIPGLAQRVRCASCGVGLRCVSDLALLWLWRRPVAAIPVQPLACEPPYASDAALKSQKKEKKEEKKELCDAFISNTK